MPQFTPAPTEEVLEVVKNKDNVVCTFSTANAIICEIDPDGKNGEVYGDLTRKYGWCVQMERYLDDSYNTLILEPITEVDR